jgi:hypothetical protein
VDERTTWLVVTRWRDEESFRAWAQSPAFAQGHRGAGHSDEGHSAAVRTGAAHAGASAASCGRTRSRAARPTESSARGSARPRRGRRPGSPPRQTPAAGGTGRSLSGVSSSRRA